MTSEQLKRTPLYEAHKRLGGKLVGFAGWELPVQFSGIIAEHNAVRQAAGIFDVSHMGEIFVTGPEAEAALNFLTCNDVRALYDGRAQYSAITNEKGGVVDDIIVYRFSREKYLLCVNASNISRDFDWLVKHNRFNAKFENKSQEYGQIAVQGPKAAGIVAKLLGRPEILDVKYYHFAESEFAGVPLILARTGYTGEDGFEIFCPAAETEKIWSGLIEVGEPEGLKPCGLGARDSLRLEAAFPLHGHELSEDVSAIESGLGWVVKTDKGDFIGREALIAQRENGSPRSLIGFFVTDPGIVREKEKVFSADGREIGITTSGTKTPTINRALGLALVASNEAKVGANICVEVRGRKLNCEIVKRPFYKRPA